MDGHSSHITANVIAFCMQNAVDLLIMPPHCSHLLQPLDVGVFAPLKHALSKKTDAVNQYDSSRISRISWVEMYIKTRIKALSTENLKAGWKGTGLIPLNPDKILNKLPNRKESASNQPQTPLEQTDLNLSLLNNSPPNDTELHKTNKLLISALDEISGLPDSVRQYTARLATITESTHTKLITARKELKSTKEILNTRKKRTKNKRVALKNKFVFSTQEVLDIAHTAEAKAETKKKRKQPRKRTIDEALDEEKAEILENVSSSSDSDCIIVARHK